MSTCQRCGLPQQEPPGVAYAGLRCRCWAHHERSLLRPPARPPKPRLRHCMGIWTCETANILAKGRTPAEAYREWSKAVAIAGAAVMRSLRPFA